MNPRYVAQAKLLLDILPFFGQEKSFAVKGGTAINLFLRKFPRLSVDIDLVYLPLQPREQTLSEIDAALNRVSHRIKRFKPKAGVLFKRGKDGRVCGFRVTESETVIKVEPNLVLRGTVFGTALHELAAETKTKLGYDEFLSVCIVSPPDLYGGKICAALDRQHPRDLFDVKILFENEGITKDIRKAFVVYLAGHDRPMAELLAPKRLNIRGLFEEEFRGMTDQDVTCEELEAVRERLISAIAGGLTENERKFLVSIKAGEPRWELLEVEGADRLPALQWKLANIRKIPEKKHAEALAKLRKVLGFK